MFNWFKNLFKQYPALVAGLLNVAVVLAAKFGFHVTPDQLVSIASAVAAFLATVLHVKVFSPLKRAARK